MIKEFAIDPELFCQWEHHRELRSQFGSEKGRLIADFPRKWKRMLSEATDRLEAVGELLPVKAQTVRDWISMYSGKPDIRFVRRAWPYDGNRTWKDNVREQANHFDVVLSHQNLEIPNALLADSELRRYVDDPLFAATTQTRVLREGRAIVDTVWPLIRASAGVIKIVEPHFNPTEPRFMRPFVQLMDRLESCSIRDVELHVLRSENFSSQTKHNYRTHIDPELRSGYLVRVFFWANKTEQLHDRFLLTNCGGIELSFGWDEGKSPGEHTTAKLLEPPIWQQEWSRYCPGCSDFDLNEQDHILTIP